MHSDKISFPTNQTLLQQQSNITLSRSFLETSRDSGEKATSAVGGSHLSFSRMLTEETEKQRRQQQFRQEQQHEPKNAQPLLAG